MNTLPEFWRQGGNDWLRRLLAPFGWVYGAATLLRLSRQGWRAPVPVISIGNFTLGGAGKTPAAITLALLLKQQGETPFVVSRGYGGREKGPRLVDHGRHSARDVGDEPLLIARHCSVIVSWNRAAGAKLAVEMGASLLILDDALQNPAIVKDFSLALVDGGFGLGNGAVVPAGPLRAPVSAILNHVDAVAIVGHDKHGLAGQFEARLPVFSAAIRPAPAAASLKDQHVFAFCGIALPEKFRATLEELGVRITGSRFFADHHAYSEADAMSLLSDAQALGCIPVTTEKDYVRLSGGEALSALAQATQVVSVKFEFAKELETAILQVLASARKRLSTASGST